ncbi:ATP-dependent Lon protease [Neisseria gonorrhoeae]|uniref:ATP-dependent Lon protease n=1 Tax=Neisseria gonorrhoeae TaxID=485 RepID=A0A378VZD8_NEIGO|nr:ATP-dependent Lon protease [Neisseria gonorrhoeae]
MQITLNEDKKRLSETKKTSKAKPRAVKVNEKTYMTTWACAASITALPKVKTASDRLPVWLGRKSAANC